VVGPTFSPPPARVPAAFGSEPNDLASPLAASEVDAAWWRGFNDPELTALVDRLITQNLDLQAAAERIRQARASRAIAASQGLPKVNAVGKVVHERESPNGEVSLVEPAPGAPLEFNDYQPQVTASWELDLFGRVRRLVEAAQAEEDAAREARRGLALAALGDLAQDYLELRQAQAEERVLLQTLAAARERIRLTQIRRLNGVATTLDAAQAEAQGASISQSLPSLHQEEARLINAVGRLLGEPPRALAAELSTPGALPAPPPTAPVGLPSELVRRRPDIRQAEAELHAATARTGVAVADFFPSVSLSGDFGFDSLHAGALFDWSSRTFMVGPTVNLPLFQGGRLKGELRLRRSQERQAAVHYRQTVLQGLQEVDDAMTRYAEAQHARRDAAAVLLADQRVLAAADEQYRQGVVTFLSVIEAQSSAYSAEDAVVQADARVAVALVGLYKALGGGWQALSS
jgi:NodT family efflux transporter outer membrane factor (OMF) lipoprotein